MHQTACLRIMNACNPSHEATLETLEKLWDEEQS